MMEMMTQRKEEKRAGVRALGRGHHGGGGHRRQRGGRRSRGTEGWTVSAASWKPKKGELLAEGELTSDWWCREAKENKE